jgi:hypothetical protein
MFTKDDSEDPLRELMRAIRGLAAAGSGQPALFPDQNVSAIELVRDFDQRVSVLREDYEDQLSSSQVESLNVLDQKLSTMSRDGAEFDADLWTDEAVRSSADWAEVRTLAAAALAELVPVSGSES